MMGAVHLLPGTTFSRPPGEGLVRRGGTGGTDLAGARAVARPADRGGLSLDGPFPARPDAPRGVAGRDRAKEVTGSIPRGSHGVFLGLSPWCHSARRARWHPLPPASILEQRVESLGWAATGASPCQVRPAQPVASLRADPGGRYWPIPYANLGLPPIALWELLEARRQQRRRGDRESSERDTFAHILQQRQIVKQATREAQQRRRGERTPSTSGASPTVNAPSEPPSAPATDLKPFPVEEWGND